MNRMASQNLQNTPLISSQEPIVKKQDALSQDVKQEFENLTIMHEGDHNRSDPQLFFSSSSKKSSSNDKSELNLFFAKQETLFQNYNQDSIVNPINIQDCSIETISREKWPNDLSLMDDNPRGDFFFIKNERQTKFCKTINPSNAKLGVKRRQGAGRKTVNPEMEKMVIDWVLCFIVKHRIFIRCSSEKERNNQNC